MAVLLWGEGESTKASEQQNTKIDNTESNSFSRPIKGNTKRDSRSIHCEQRANLCDRRNRRGRETQEDNIVIIELIEQAVNLVVSMAKNRELKSNSFHPISLFTKFLSTESFKIFSDSCTTVRTLIMA